MDADGKPKDEPAERKTTENAAQPAADADGKPQTAAVGAEGKPTENAAKSEEDLLKTADADSPPKENAAQPGVDAV